ncbi:MAG: hypothetical protein QM817_21965 [Archangium sp.]
MGAPSAIGGNGSALAPRVSPRTESLIAVGLLVVAVGVFALRWSQQRSGLSVDLGEPLVLAQHVAAGDGPRLTAASTVSVGPPNLVWFGVYTGLSFVGASVETWLPRIAALLSAIALVLLAFRGPVVWKRPLRVEDVVPALAMSLVTANAEAAALGSGAAVWTCFVAICALALGRSLGAGRALRIGALLGAMTLFRPSAAWFVLAAAPAWAIAAKLEGRKALGEVARFLLGGAVVAALVFALRFVVFGSMSLEGFFPSDVGVERTLEFLSRQARWFWAALAALMLAAVWRRFHLRGGGTLLAWVLTTVVVACWTDQPRPLFLACLPLLAMLVGEGLSAARERAILETDEPTLARLAWLGLGTVAVLLVMAASASYALGSIMPALGVTGTAPEVQEELKRRGLQQPLVAWSDAVEAATLFPGARVVIVKTPSRTVEDLLVSEGPPDLVDGRIVIETMPRLSETVTAGPGGARWLVEQSADDDPRCPDGRLALLSTPPEQLLVAIEKDVEDGLPQKALARWRCALGALTGEHLPTLEARREASVRLAEKAKMLESQGSLEPAIRVGALASSLAGEPALMRARVERLRQRWLDAP